MGMRSEGDVVVEHAGITLPEPATHAFDLFVVHAAADTDFVRGYLLPALNLPASRVLLMDEIPLGAVVVSEIDAGVSRSRFTVAVLSPAYLEDRWAVFGEHLASHLSARDVHVIPLRLLDCELPLRLDARVALDFRDHACWELEVARLRDLLHTAAPVAEQLPCPYPGMRPFTEHEASRFFGRDQEIDDLIGRLDGGEREIYVIGPSGSGKSSLVQAGLLHVLDAGSSRLARSFVVRTMRPGERPTERLARALEGDLAIPAVTLADLVARHPPAARVLVFIDQIEELFTLADVDERQRFISTLRALRAATRCYLLLALRADFFGALMDSELWPDLAGRISRLEVAPLQGATLARAITAPAISLGVHLETRLCDRLVADAAAEPGALPHVQETLRLLWDRRRQRLLGFAEYEALGGGGRGLGVALARRADATIRTLTVAQQTIARRVLLRLVSFGEGRADTRRQQPIEALRSAADSDAEFSRVLQQLVDDRLVTLDGSDVAGQGLADLSHEALITAWSALQEWIAGRRADEQQRRRLEAKVGEWIGRGRGTASLLDSVELSEAVHWIQSDVARELGYVAELPALVAASQRELDKVERQRRRRTVRAVAVLAAFSVVASILGLVAWRQRQQAHRLLGMNYLEQGRALQLGGHPMQALPYFVAARAEAAEDPELRMLFAQASRNLPLATFVGHGLFASGSIFSPDGTRVVDTSSQDNMVRVWDTATGKPVTPPLEYQDVVFTVLPVEYQDAVLTVTAAFSPDGMRVITGGEDKAARVWDASTGRALTPPLNHDGSVNVVAFSLDGTRVVTVSGKTVRVWDASTGKPVSPPLEHQGTVNSASLSPDGTRVVTASDEMAWVWDASTGKPVSPQLQHHGLVYTAVFSRDGTRVVTASGDKTARVWDAAMGNAVTPSLQHRDSVHVAAFSPDGMRVITASWDKTARVWDASTGTPVSPPLVHHGQVNAAVFSPDGTHVVTASWDKTARVWDASTGMPVSSPLEHQGAVLTAAFSPDGSRVITGSRDKMERVWDASAGTPATPSLEHQDSVHVAAFSRDGTRVVTASKDKTARVWDALTGMPVTPPLEHQDVVSTAAFSPDGTRVVTASWDKTARVWDASTGAPVSPPLVHHGQVNAAAFSPDGTRVVTASWDKTARVWDASTGAPVSPPLVHLGQVNVAAFSPDGTRVVTASLDGTARVWDASTGRPVSPLLEHQGAVLTAAFSPDGTRVVTASWDKTARVWDASTGAPVSPPLEHQDQVTTAAFNPDGTRIVTASRDKTARVWDASTGKPVSPPLEHPSPVRGVVFSPDSARVVTASEDNAARVWDATTGNPVTPPLEHPGGNVRSAVFSPDGQRVVTASDDSTARFWTLSIDMGSLEDWRLLARCSPFVLVNGVLTPNPDPRRACPRH
jgi:WD40 repeat protein